MRKILRMEERMRGICGGVERAEEYCAGEPSGI